MINIVILGSGNVATLLGTSLSKAGYNIIQVWSRNLEHAKALANLLHTQFTDDIDQVVDSADLYILSISDDAIPSAVSKMKPVNGVIAHTSGSTSIDVFHNKFSNYGVFRSEEHTSELQSIMRISYAVFCLKIIHKQQLNFMT